MDLKALATELISKHFQQDSAAGSDQVANAVQGLFGGNFDVAALVEKFSSGGGLASQVQSWLGDGENAPISASNIMDMFGSDSVSKFAGDLGIDQQTAANGLSDVIPQLIDKCSSGGSLLESVGGLGGALDMAKGLFGKK